MPFADERTLQAIEFSHIRDRVIAQTRTERGRERARSLLPCTDFEQIRREQARTAATRGLVNGSDFHVAQAVETEALTVAAAQGRVLAPRELRLVGEAVAASASAARAVRDDPVLRDVVAGYTVLDDLRRALADAIDERDMVLDRASPALARIRKQVRQAQDESRERVSSLLRSPKYAAAIQDTVVTVREGRYVVPIKAEFSGEFPGIVHDTSASGQTFFVEPLAALEANNCLRRLRIEEGREIERVLRELSARIGERAAAIEGNVEILALLDVLAAKARLADTMDAVAPDIDEDAVLEVRSGRHPLLLSQAIPQSLRLDDEVRLIVISGPNMGGKTVTLKMVGLFLAMTYAGLQIPAAQGSRVGRFSQLIADIGDEQSIAANASTFSAHLDRMREIFQRSDARALVLVDEIGSGTEPSAGAALAIAMLERLLRTRARCIVTTHATELKLFAHKEQGAVNASVRFDAQSFAPTYHLDIGSPGQSFSFALARARRVDEATVARAESLLASEEREYERALEELAARTSELQVQRDALERERAFEVSERAALERKETELRTEQDRFVQRAEERLQRTLREFLAELQRTSPEQRRAARLTPSQNATLARTLEAMHRELGLPERERSGEARRSVKLDLPLTGMQQRRGSGPSVHFEAAAATRVELDVRGKRYAEAEPMVDRWLDEALLGGSRELRLIHGKGTGMLGRGLQAHLREHSAIAHVRYGSEEEGSHGVTIIELKEQ